MTRLALLGLSVLAGLAFAMGPALAQDDGDKPAAPQSAAVPGPPPSGPVSTAKVGFLDLKNDVQLGYSRPGCAGPCHVCLD